MCHKTYTPEDEVTVRSKLTIDLVLVILASEHFPFDSIG